MYSGIIRLAVDRIQNFRPLLQCVIWRLKFVTGDIQNNIIINWSWYVYGASKQIVTSVKKKLLKISLDQAIQYFI